MFDTTETIVLYLTIMLIMMISTALTPSNIIGKKKTQYFYYILPIGLYTLFWGLRYNVGADYLSYQHMYENIYAYADYIEHGFVFLIYFLKQLNLSSVSLFLITSFIPITLLYISACEKKTILIFSIFFYFTTTIVLFNQNGIRQAIALAILLLICAKKDLYKWTILLVLGIISILFHKSAVIPLSIFLIIYLLPTLTEKKILFNKYLLILIVLSLQVYGQTLYNLLINNIEPLFLLLDYHNFSHVDKWDKNVVTSSGIGVIIRILTYCIAIFYAPSIIKKNQYRSFYIFYIFFIIGILLEPIIAQNSYFKRMNLYFLSTRIFIYSYLLDYLITTRKNKIINFFIITFIITTHILLFIYELSNNSNLCVPYQYLF